MARSMSGWMPALHGFIVEWPLATPTIGLSKSPSPKPTARSIARFGERATPWVMRRERRLWVMLRIVRSRRPPLQCNRNAAVIPYRYGSAGVMAVAVFLGGGRAPALRAGRRGAAHLPAAAVAGDPGARDEARRDAVRPQPAARRAHTRGHAAFGRGAAHRGPARAHGP